MKSVKITMIILVMLLFMGLNETKGQWNTSGSNIYNTNTGNVGIGNSSPSTLLHVAKNITEPTITVQNLGGTGGATYTMVDNASGANWKFKATLSGGFKIRDHANGLDVFVIEPNSSANALYINSAGTVGIGTSTPDNSALVDMSSASKGFLPPRMTQVQIGEILNPANGLVVFCTTDSKFYSYIADAYNWKEILFGSSTISSTCGSITKNHVTGTVAPVTKTVTYGTVANIPGAPSKCWITSNLGANQQATAVDDDTEPSAGWYWQFNRKQGFKHDGTTRTPNTTWIFSIDESSNWVAAKDPCALELGGGWRLPTSTEWTNVDASGNWTDWYGPWDSGLKLHAAGYLYASTSNLADIAFSGNYWSSTQFDNLYSWFLNFESTGDCSPVYNEKARAQTVRCLRAL